MLSPAKAERFLFHATSSASAALPTYRGRPTIGDFTNGCCALIALAGIVLILVNEMQIGRPATVVGSCGLVAGLLNALFIHLLFHPGRLGCLGAGVFQREASSVAIQLQRQMVHAFFSPHQLAASATTASFRSVQDLVQVFLHDDDHDSHQILVNALTHVASTPNGAVLNSFAGLFGGIEPMVPKVKPLLIALAAEWDQQNNGAEARLQWIFGMSSHDELLQRLSQEINNMVHTRVMRLEPHEVSVMVESLVRHHLAWIVVWGNVCGLCLGGLLVLLLSYYSL
ncbi:hypothetical protein AC1031_006042 [Aphanomyces cochlioides]|nr:hypothetical protein AC1031_006042 [Aphanomyces cochlioides]